MESPSTDPEVAGADQQAALAPSTAVTDEQKFVTHRDIEPLRDHCKKFDEGVDGKPALKQQLEDTVNSTNTALDQAEETAKRVRNVELDLIGGEGKEGVVKKVEGLLSQVQQAAEKIATAEKDIMSFHHELHGDEEKKVAGIKKELKVLNNLVSAYFDLAELSALEQKPMHMADHVRELDTILGAAGRKVLENAGHISHAQAEEKARAEYRKYKAQTLDAVEKDYLDTINALGKEAKTKSREQ